jgi:hypothetical protein
MATVFTGPSHHTPRDDAVWAHDHAAVPTTLETKWVHTMTELRAAGGFLNFNADQTEITLTLPEGFKFGIRFHPEV